MEQIPKEGMEVIEAWLKIENGKKSAASSGFLFLRLQR